MPSPYPRFASAVFAATIVATASAPAVTGVVPRQTEQALHVRLRPGRGQDGRLQRLQEPVIEFALNPLLETAEVGEVDSLYRAGHVRDDLGVRLDRDRSRVGHWLGRRV